EKSLYLKNYTDDQFSQIISFSHEEEKFFLSMYYDSINDLLFLGSNTNILELKDTKIIAEHSATLGKKDIVYSNNELIYLLKKNSDRIFWGDTAIELSSDKKKKLLYNFSQTSDETWVCTSNGVFELDLNNQKIGEHLLADKRITDIVVDHENNHWISSLDEGLFYMPNRKIKLLQIAESTNKPHKITSIVSDFNDNIFLGTSDGKIIQLDSDKKEVMKYSGLNESEIEYIFPFENKLLTSVGLFELGNETPQIAGYFGKNATKDAFGNILMANYNLAGLLPITFLGQPVLPYQLETKQTIDYINSSLQLYIFRNKRARAVHYSQFNESYYIGFSDALYRFGIDGSIEEIKTVKNQPIIATDFHESENGIIWVASSQQGLLSIKNNQVLQHFDTINGLSNNKCKKIYADDMGIWIITDSSLDLYDFNTKQLVNYGNNLGLNGLAINDFMVTSKQIWFATNKGVIYFDKSVLNQELKPFFELTVHQNTGEELTENTVLPFNKNTVLVEFNSVFYKSLGSYQFEYKLEPFHEHWQIQDAKQNQLNFVSLDPSNYLLRARLKTGSLISSEVNFPFVVNHPFWLQNWFLLLAFLVVFLMFILVYRWAVVRTQKKQDIKEMLAVSQLTALRSQMNPHFMFNVLNAIQGLIYSNQKNKANRYIGTFSTLMRKTLDFSAKKHIPIAEEIETIKLYVSLEKARFDDGEFDYEISLPDEDLSIYSIPSLIIQPFIENAIKHGLLHKAGQKKIVFTLQKKNSKYWQFIIEDNGIGRKASNQINEKTRPSHVSFASNAIKTRIDLINKLIHLPITIKIEDLYSNQNQPQGTKVILNIPIKPIQE
ncbi:MAG: histidine kinase, partial [Flavobacteriaceae bacterium]|nr:histidine kinase [Flavobacteriaceae bacterium]